MRVSWIAALCLLSVAQPSPARPYTVDDLLALEGYGEVLIDPTERWAVIERRGAWSSARRFDFGFRTAWMTARLEVVDLDDPGRPVPLFEQPDGAGYWSAGFSPSGRSLAVFRLDGERFTLGILDMGSRQVRWLDIAPDLPLADPRPAWADENHIVYVGRPTGALPRTFTTGWSQRRLAETFELARRGAAPSLTIYGAGAYRDLASTNDTSTVVRVNVRTGRIETLLTGNVADIALSPGGRQLAVVERGTVIPPDPAVPVGGTFQPRRSRLAIVDLADGRVRRICETCDLMPYLLRWSPDGSALLFFARRDGGDWTDGHLYRLAATAPTATAVAPGLSFEVREIGANLSLAADWIGDEAVARARPRGAASAFRWYRLSDGDARALDAAPGDELIAAAPSASLWASGSRLVRRGPEGVSQIEGTIISHGTAIQDLFEAGGRRVFAPRRTGPVPVMLAGPGSEATISLLDPRAAQPLTSLALPAAHARLLAIARRGIAVSFDRDAQGVGTLRLLRAGRPAIVLGRSNRHLSDVEPGRRIAVRAPGPDGAMLTHWLTLPPGSGPDTPLVVIPYPGMVRQPGPPPPIDPSQFSPAANPALLAGAGYAVLEPSLPTEPADDASIVSSIQSGGSIALRSRASDADPGPRLAPTVLAAVDAAVATGRVSGERVAVYGHSFGGWAAMMLATRTERFRAIVAAAGPYDFFASYGNVSPSLDHAELGVSDALSFSFTEDGAANLGGPPWRVPERYLAYSPLYAADRITTPVMLIHGDMDFIPYSIAERMLMAMHRLDRDAILLRYGGEGHVMASPANIRDQWRRMLAFLGDHLAPDSAVQRPQ